MPIERPEVIWVIREVKYIVIYIYIHIYIIAYEFPSSGGGDKWAMTRSVTSSIIANPIRVMKRSKWRMFPLPMPVPSVSKGMASAAIEGEGQRCERLIFSSRR